MKNQTEYSSCKKATELIEKKQLFKLTLGETIKLFTHQLICSECKKYEQKSLKINALLEKSISSKIENSTSEELKNKIISKL